MESKAETIEECWIEAKLGQPYCFLDSREQWPDWFAAAHPDGMYWYYDVQDGFLELRGLRIPLTTRWILCPKHEHLAQEEVEGANVLHDAPESDSSSDSGPGTSG